MDTSYNVREYVIYGQCFCYVDVLRGEFAGSWIIGSVAFNEFFEAVQKDDSAAAREILFSRGVRR